MKDNQLPIFFRYRMLWHILFWVVVYAAYVITFGGYWGNYYEEMINNLVLMPVRIIGTYVLIYWILPLALNQKRFYLFAILTVIHAVIFANLIWWTLRFTNFFPEHVDYSTIPLFYPAKTLGTLFSNYVIPLFAASVIIFKKWFVDELQKKKLTEEKMSAELSFLKSQIHPHFLFNTLNNLYALTLIKSEKTPDVVLKLSGLLDYMIYKSNDKFVDLSNELEILKSYIELEELRYNNRLDLKYEISGETVGYKIAPLILLPFIENSFKHGAGNDRSNPKICIQLKTHKQYLELIVVNSIKSENEKDETLQHGIGLKNVGRRLELIYPGAHQLEIEKTQSEFRVQLIINWKND